MTEAGDILTFPSLKNPEISFQIKKKISSNTFCRIIKIEDEYCEIFFSLYKNSYRKSGIKELSENISTQYCISKFIIIV